MATNCIFGYHEAALLLRLSSFRSSKLLSKNWLALAGIGFKDSSEKKRSCGVHPHLKLTRDIWFSCGYDDRCHKKLEPDYSLVCLTKTDRMVCPDCDLHIDASSAQLSLIKHLSMISTWVAQEKIFIRFRRDTICSLGYHGRTPIVFLYSADHRNGNSSRFCSANSRCVYVELWYECVE